MSMDFPVTDEFAASANAGQLHDECRGDSPEWPASFVPNEDGWVYRVDERDDVTIDALTVQAALDGHVPEPPPPTTEELLAQALTRIETLEAAVAAVGNG